MNAEENDLKKIAERLHQGDPVAFRIIYEAYAPRLAGYCAGFGFTKEEADEIIQDTFVRLWKSREKIVPQNNLEGYIVTIAKHLVYNSLRNRSYRENYIREMGYRLEKSRSAGNEERELQQLISKAMQQLPDRCRQIFKKNKLEGYSVSQIAEEMHISKSTVENQLNKGLKIIRRSLEKEGYKPTALIFLIIELFY